MTANGTQHTPVRRQHVSQPRKRNSLKASLQKHQLHTTSPKPRKRCLAGATAASDPLSPTQNQRSVSGHAGQAPSRHSARSALTSHRRAALPGAAGLRHRRGPTRCSSATTREGGCLSSEAQLQPLHAWLPGQQPQHLPEGRGGHSRSTDPRTPPPAPQLV